MQKKRWNRIQWEKNKSIEIAQKALSNELDIKTVSIITGLSENLIKE